MTSYDKNYKNCITPGCKSTTAATPDKVFITVPLSKKIRKAWWDAIRREPPVNTGVCFCCEDHFKVRIFWEVQLYNFIYLL